MMILTKTDGEFVFLDEDYNQVEFTDFRSIPKNFKFKHVIKFLPNIPPPPHTVQQHEEIHLWNKRFEEMMRLESK